MTTEDVNKKMSKGALDSKTFKAFLVGLGVILGAAAALTWIGSHPDVINNTQGYLAMIIGTYMGANKTYDTVVQSIALKKMPDSPAPAPQS